MKKVSFNSFIQALGPGLLFASLSIGVSHIVQSTRAGAEFGFALVIVIFLALFFKYPAFKFGSHYAAATGHSLVHGYHKQGNWALILFTVLLLTTMFTLQAAVTFTTAALAKFMLGFDNMTNLSMAILLTLSCILLVGFGKYHWVDRVNKVLVLTFTATTFTAAIMVLPTIDWGTFHYLPVIEQMQLRDFIFIAALAGWMPTAIDISVLNSLWTLAKKRDTHHNPTLQESHLDYNIGYIVISILAFACLILGAAVLYHADIAFASTSEDFAIQLIKIYTEVLGDWTIYIISLAAFSVMFSTMLAVVDGYPRLLGVITLHFTAPNEHDHEQKLHDSSGFKWFLLFFIAGIAMSIIAWFQHQFLALVDLATTTAFITAPVLAWLNHKAVFGKQVADHLHPSKAMYYYSWAGITVLAIFAIAYVSLRIYLL